ncbi:MAG TPA: hypothetical protein DIT50_01575 [Rhodocyclaceae bacterium]|nr:hypothetical protein [Rhodocyclaceae bacterium]
MFTADLIVMYHGVVPDDEPLDDWLQVPASRFRDQLAFFTRWFTPVCVETFFTTPRKAWQKPRLLVTFDDGYANNLTVAAPILQEYRVPALFFLATGYLETPWFWWDRLQASLATVGQKPSPALIAEIKALAPPDVEAKVTAILRDRGANPFPPPTPALRPLTWREAQQLASLPGFAIGNHGHCHEIFAHLDDTALTHTLTLSQRLLTERLGVQPTWIAPPNGDWRRDQIDRFAQLGFQAIFTTQPGWVTRRQRASSPVPRVFPRIGIGATDRPLDLAKRLLKTRLRQTVPTGEGK